MHQEPDRLVILPSHRIATQDDCWATDNLPTHKSPRAAQAQIEGGCWFPCSGKRPSGAFPDPSNLPAYGPGLNPMEMALLSLKAHLPRVGASPFDT